MTGMSCCEGIQPGDGRAVTDGAMSGDAATGAGGGGMAGSCTNLDGPVATLASLDDVKSFLANQWAYCSGEPANFKEPTELTLDGHWFRLTRDSSGKLVQKFGFGRSGTYEIIPQGPPPWTYVDILFRDDSYGSTLITNLAFIDSPRVMQNGPGIYVPAR